MNSIEYYNSKQANGIAFINNLDEIEMRSSLKKVLKKISPKGFYQMPLIIKNRKVSLPYTEVTD